MFVCLLLSFGSCFSFQISYCFFILFHLDYALIFNHWTLLDSFLQMSLCHCILKYRLLFLFFWILILLPFQDFYFLFVEKICWLIYFLILFRFKIHLYFSKNTNFFLKFLVKITQVIIILLNFDFKTVFRDWPQIFLFKYLICFALILKVQDLSF